MACRIAPSILAADCRHRFQQVQEPEAEGTNWILVDVVDGQFMPNITMGPFIVASVRRAVEHPLDVRLLLEQPERYLPDVAEAGAGFLTVHVGTWLVAESAVFGGGSDIAANTTVLRSRVAETDVEPAVRRSYSV
jgi:pentose-5-phosphate-3-epimerase